VPGADLADAYALPRIDTVVAQAGLDDPGRAQPVLEQRDAPLELKLLFPRVEVVRVLGQVRLARRSSAQALGHPAPLLELQPLELLLQPFESLARDHQVVHLARSLL
jgi:hypothetical protein